MCYFTSLEPTSSHAHHGEGPTILKVNITFSFLYNLWSAICKCRSLVSLLNCAEFFYLHLIANTLGVYILYVRMYVHTRYQSHTVPRMTRTTRWWSKCQMTAQHTYLYQCKLRTVELNTVSMWQPADKGGMIADCGWNRMKQWRSMHVLYT